MRRSFVAPQNGTPQDDNRGESFGIPRRLWIESEPEAPEGLWYKDFGSFQICGEGRFPETFLLPSPPRESASDGFGLLYCFKSRKSRERDLRYKATTAAPSRNGRCAPGGPGAHPPSLPR